MATHIYVRHYRGMILLRSHVVNRHRWMHRLLTLLPVIVIFPIILFLCYYNPYCGQLLVVSGFNVSLRTSQSIWCPRISGQPVNYGLYEGPQTIDNLVAQAENFSDVTGITDPSAHENTRRYLTQTTIRPDRGILGSNKSTADSLTPVSRLNSSQYTPKPRAITVINNVANNSIANSGNIYTNENITSTNIANGTLSSDTISVNTSIDKAVHVTTAAPFKTNGTLHFTIFPTAEYETTVTKFTEQDSSIVATAMTSKTTGEVVRITNSSPASSLNTSNFSQSGNTVSYYFQRSTLLSSLNPGNITDSQALLAATLSNRTWREHLNGLIWPRTSAGEINNRIEEQLDILELYRRIKEATGGVTRKKVILGVGQFNMGLLKEGQETFINEGCPVDWCSATRDPALASSADALLISEYNSANEIRSPKPPGQIWIAQHLESPKHNRIDAKLLRDKINWTATYRTDSTVVFSYGRFTKNTKYTQPTNKNLESASVIESREHTASNKSGLVAVLISNCEASNHRLYYVHQLAKHIQVDIYGACGKHRCPKKFDHSSVACAAWLGKHYKFYLAFENSNCKDYITEKLLYNALLNNMLPVVMGASKKDYEIAAPPNSYIHVSDFRIARDLAEYLLRVHQNDTLYESYFQWKKEGWGLLIDQRYYCRLCTMLHLQADVEYLHWYEDYHSWWNSGCYN